jgi:hypothetical protein
VQAKYLPRGLIIDRATGVRTFVWLIVGATDGNEMDDFGMLHGLLYKPQDFTPRPAFFSLQNTNTLFSDTRLDPSIEVKADVVSGESERPITYAFRAANGKAIVAYWLPVLSKAGMTFTGRRVTLRLVNSGIRNPVLIDITTGKISKLSWKPGATDVIEQLPLLDSVLAVADASYLDWVELPEAPSGLVASKSSVGIQLTWEVHDGHPEVVTIERRSGKDDAWKQIARLPATTNVFADSNNSGTETLTSYRVRALNAAGKSAYSNVVNVDFASSDLTQ